MTAYEMTSQISDEQKVIIAKIEKAIDELLKNEVGQGFDPVEMKEAFVKKLISSRRKKLLEVGSGAKLEKTKLKKEKLLQELAKIEKTLKGA